MREGELERFFLGREGGGGGGGGNGVEDYEDGAALGGGEGGDGRVEVGMGWAGEGEWQVLVGSGVVGGVEEQADELTAIIGSGKKRCRGVLTRGHRGGRAWRDRSKGCCPCHRTGSKGLEENEE